DGGIRGKKGTEGLKIRQLLNLSPLCRRLKPGLRQCMARLYGTVVHACCLLSNYVHFVLTLEYSCSISRIRGLHRLRRDSWLHNIQALRPHYRVQSLTSTPHCLAVDRLSLAFCA